MNYRQALAWLFGTQQFGIKLGLENTEGLLAAVGIRLGSAGARPAVFGAPAKTPRIIHVAGTNGKGSVCAFADAILRAAGFRVGLFTSPHLVCFRERIRVNGEMMSESAVARGLTAIHDLVKHWDPHPTFFEITTALALWHFQETRCQFVILETGMGGRLDATNAINSDVSVITPVARDHEEWLGYSIAEIAAEKAGIIKPQTPVVSAPQVLEAEHVIVDRAAECRAALRFVTEEWTQSPVGLRGSHQKLNAAVGVAAVRELEPAMSAEPIARGLLCAEWPARFQVWNERIVIDGAHNPAALHVLVQTWCDQFHDERATVALAVLRDKNAAEIIATLRSIAQRFVLPRIRSQRAIPPEELAQLITKLAPSIPCLLPGSVADAIAVAEREPERILITGSLHFAGEALAHLRGTPDALEDCAQ